MYSLLGLRAWRQQNARKRIERIDEGNNESLGTQLGRRKICCLSWLGNYSDLRGPVRPRVRQETGGAEEEPPEERGGGGVHQTPCH